MNAYQSRLQPPTLGRMVLVSRLPQPCVDGVLCPCCYIGEHRLAQAIKDFEHAGDVELNIHMFQIDPHSPATVSATVDYLANKVGMPAAQVRPQEELLARQVRSEGLTYEVDRPTSNSFDMLRLVHLGNEHGVGWEYLRAMQHEVFSGNQAAFEHDTLVRLGEDLGIPATDIRAVLNSNKYAAETRADQQQATAMGPPAHRSPSWAAGSASPAPSASCSTAPQSARHGRSSTMTEITSIETNAVVPKNEVLGQGQVEGYCDPVTGAGPTCGPERQLPRSTTL